MPEYDITFDKNYIRRQFEKAVGRSVVKVLTEPMTNSDDSYERLKALGLDALPGFGEIVVEYDRTNRAFAICQRDDRAAKFKQIDAVVEPGRRDRHRPILRRVIFDLLRAPPRDGIPPGSSSCDESAGDCAIQSLG
ncbi:MAG: hypothetical protein DLM71_04095 [Chloroflexi bacterium]|nr:MAG: hypothetical protein DLM71_04095 [Chloroflexota bacterium]